MTDNPYPVVAQIPDRHHAGEVVMVVDRGRLVEGRYVAFWANDLETEHGAGRNFASLNEAVGYALGRCGWHVSHGEVRWQDVDPLRILARESGLLP